MIQSRFASSLAFAALFAVPAFAATNPQADVSSGTTTANGAYVAPLDKAGAKQTAAAKAAKPGADRSASGMEAHADVNCGTTTANGAYVAPLEKAGAKQTAAAQGKSTDQKTVAGDCVPKAKMAKKKSAKTASNQ
ncbi:MAG TPA: hypothetical protein VM051_05020 [Usitatibacter sp.]|nr:hypothetical protein [Usitatibacter sp.]